MSKRKIIAPTPLKICSDCLHYNACAAWNVGSIANMDGTHCVNYERYVYSTPLQAKPQRKPLIYIAQPYGNKPENHALAITYMLRLTETYREYVFISPVISYGFAYDIY